MSKIFKIRNAVVHDIAMIVEMRLALHRHMAKKNPNLWHVTKEWIDSRSAFYRRQLDDSASSLIVMADSQAQVLVGMCLGRIREHDEFVPAKSGQIDDVWVAPQFRRRGFCRRMMGKLVAFFRLNDVDALVLEYVEGDAGAEKTWQALGFRQALKIATGRVSDNFDMNERDKPYR